jgi:hypothetical protein
MGFFIFLSSCTFAKLSLAFSLPSLSFGIYFVLNPKSDSTSVLGGCRIQFRQNKQKEYFEYTLIDSMKDWRTEWFYASNMSPPLVVHSDAGPVVNNDRWEKAP